MLVATPWSNAGKKSGRGYDETIYAIAARCYHLWGDVIQAREVLETLIHHGTSHDAEHRKLLGYTYLRLDELEPAGKLLNQAVSERPTDVEARLMLSGVFSARGQFGEAVAHAHAAVRVAPANHQAHAAFLGAVLTLPGDFKPSAELAAAHQETFDFLVQHPSHIVQTVPVDDDFKHMTNMLRERRKHVERVQKVYSESNVPFGFFAQQIGVPLYQAWASRMGSRDLPLKMAFGSHEEQNAEVVNAAAAQSVSVDLLGLFTLQRLGHLELLPALYPRIVTHITLLETIVAGIRGLRFEHAGGQISYDRGRIVMTPDDPARRAKEAAALTEIRNFLRSPHVTFVGLSPDACEGEKMEAIRDGAGPAVIVPIFISEEQKAALFSDDAAVRGLAKHIAEIPGFCTQALLRVAKQRELLSAEQYNNAVLRLFEWRYTFVSDDVGVLQRAYTMAEGKITPQIEDLIRRPERGECDIESALSILAAFLAFVWTANPRACHALLSAVL